MNVFRHELRFMRTGLVIWALALVGLLALYIGLYPAFSHDADMTREMIAKFPPELKAAFGIDAETMLSFLGFFSFTFTNVTLAAGMFSAHMGVTLFSREQRSRTTDFLLTRPVSRARLFVQKFLAGLLGIVAIWSLMTVAAFVFAKLFGAGDFSLKRFALLMVALLIVQVWLYGFGVLLTQLLRRIKSTIPVTLATTFGFFLVGVLAAILRETWLYYFSPFRFFDYVGIAKGSGYDIPLLVVAGVTLCLSLVLSFVRYTRRDERAVS